MTKLILIPRELLGEELFVIVDDTLHISSYIESNILYKFTKEKGKELFIVNRLPLLIIIPSASRDEWSKWYKLNARLPL